MCVYIGSIYFLLLWRQTFHSLFTTYLHVCFIYTCTRRYGNLNDRVFHEDNRGMRDFEHFECRRRDRKRSRVHTHFRICSLKARAFVFIMFCRNLYFLHQRAHLARSLCNSVPSSYSAISVTKHKEALLFTHPSEKFALAWTAAQRLLESFQFRNIEKNVTGTSWLILFFVACTRARLIDCFSGSLFAASRRNVLARTIVMKPVNEIRTIFSRVLVIRNDYARRTIQQSSLNLIDLNRCFTWTRQHCILYPFVLFRKEVLHHEIYSSYSSEFLFYTKKKLEER